MIGYTPCIPTERFVARMPRPLGTEIHYAPRKPQLLGTVMRGYWAGMNGIDMHNMVRVTDDDQCPKDAYKKCAKKSNKKRKG